MLYHVLHSSNSGNENEIGLSYEFSSLKGSGKRRVMITSRDNGDILVPPDGPLPITARLYQDAAQGWYVENLEDHNNVFVNDVLSRGRRLHDGDLISLGSIIFRFLDGKGKESMFHRGLQRVIGIDVLTGISNRRQLFEELKRAMASCKRSKRPFCLVLIDFDNFSGINNQYGHAAGDMALKEMIAKIRTNIRTEDVFGRYGGEEFLLGLPNLTKEKAFAFMERVRKKTTKDPIGFNDSPIRVTFSAGLTEWKPPMELEALKNKADELMYKAKARGKNQVAMEE